MATTENNNNNKMSSIELLKKRRLEKEKAQRAEVEALASGSSNTAKGEITRADEIAKIKGGQESIMKRDDGSYAREKAGIGELGDVNSYDIARLGAFATDLAGIGLAASGVGSIGAAVTGIASTAMDAYADSEDGFDMSDLGSAALGLGLDVFSLIPFGGSVAKTAKAAKGLKKMLPIMTRLATAGTLAAYGATGAMDSIQKAKDYGISSLNANDYANIGRGLQAVLGGVKGIKKNVAHGMAFKKVEAADIDDVFKVAARKKKARLIKKLKADPSSIKDGNYTPEFLAKRQSILDLDNNSHELFPKKLQRALIQTKGKVSSAGSGMWGTNELEVPGRVAGESRAKTWARKYTRDNAIAVDKVGFDFGHPTKNYVDDGLLPLKNKTTNPKNTVYRTPDTVKPKASDVYAGSDPTVKVVESRIARDKIKSTPTNTQAPAQKPASTSKSGSTPKADTEISFSTASKNLTPEAKSKAKVEMTLRKAKARKKQRIASGEDVGPASKFSGAGKSTNVMESTTKKATDKADALMKKYGPNNSKVPVKKDPNSKNSILDASVPYHPVPTVSDKYLKKYQPKPDPEPAPTSWISKGKPDIEFAGGQTHNPYVVARAKRRRAEILNEKRIAAEKVDIDNRFKANSDRVNKVKKEIKSKEEALKKEVEKAKAMKNKEAKDKALKEAKDKRIKLLKEKQKLAKEEKKLKGNSKDKSSGNRKRSKKGKGHVKYRQGGKTDPVSSKGRHFLRNKQQVKNYFGKAIKFSLSGTEAEPSNVATGEEAIKFLRFFHMDKDYDLEDVRSVSINSYGIVKLSFKNNKIPSKSITQEILEVDSTLPNSGLTLVEQEAQRKKNNLPERYTIKTGRGLDGFDYQVSDVEKGVSMSISEANNVLRRNLAMREDMSKSIGDPTLMRDPFVIFEGAGAGGVTHVRNFGEDSIPAIDFGNKRLKWYKGESIKEVEADQKFDGKGNALSPDEVGRRQREQSLDILESKGPKTELEKIMSSKRESFIDHNPNDGYKGQVTKLSDEGSTLPQIDSAATDVLNANQKKLLEKYGIGNLKYYGKEVGTNETVYIDEGGNRMTLTDLETRMQLDSTKKVNEGYGAFVSGLDLSDPDDDIDLDIKDIVNTIKKQDIEEGKKNDLRIKAEERKEELLNKYKNHDLNVKDYVELHADKVGFFDAVKPNTIAQAALIGAAYFDDTTADLKGPAEPILKRHQDVGVPQEVVDEIDRAKAQINSMEIDTSDPLARRDFLLRQSKQVSELSDKMAGYRQQAYAADKEKEFQVNMANIDTKNQHNKERIDFENKTEEMRVQQKMARKDSLLKGLGSLSAKIQGDYDKAKLDKDSLMVKGSMANLTDALDDLDTDQRSTYYDTSLKPDERKMKLAQIAEDRRQIRLFQAQLRKGIVSGDTRGYIDNWIIDKNKSRNVSTKTPTVDSVTTTDTDVKSTTPVQRGRAVQDLLNVSKTSTTPKISEYTTSSALGELGYDQNKAKKDILSRRDLLNAQLKKEAETEVDTIDYSNSI